MARPRHIAILKADEVDPALSPSFGKLEDMMAAMLELSSHCNFECSTFHVYQSEFPSRIDDFEGYLITGSRVSVYDDLDWIAKTLNLVRELNRQKRRVVGICFGHQLLAQALGGKVERANQGWGVGVQRYKVGPELSHGLGVTHVSLPCCHQDQVVQLPAESSQILSSEFCEHAGFVIGEHILGLQPHPEFSVSYLECILRSIEEKIPDRID